MQVLQPSQQWGVCIIKWDIRTSFRGAVNCRHVDLGGGGAAGVAQSRVMHIYVAV